MPEAQSFTTREGFRESGAWGLATAIDLYGCDAGAVRDRGRIESFARELCDLLGVRRFGEPVCVRFGAHSAVHGYSLVQLIETSLISAHFAEATNTAYLDIFSCAWYDTPSAVEFARAAFGGSRVRVRQTLRL